MEQLILFLLLVLIGAVNANQISKLEQKKAR